MGCNFSKIDELEALALCRSRCDLLAEAIRHRYALADAHAAYADSLRSVGVALHRVLDGGHPDSFPVLPLPGKRKGDPVLPSLSRATAPSSVPQPPPAAIPMAQSHSHSHSGSHIDFHSDYSDSDDISPLHSDGDSPVHFHPDHDVKQGGGPANANLHYARNNPPSSNLIEQRVGSPNQVKYGTSSEPSSFFPFRPHHTAQHYNSSEHLHRDNNENKGSVSINVNHHYARNNPPPSVSFEQHIGSPEQVKFGSVSEPSSSSFYPYGHHYMAQNTNLHTHSFSYAFPPNYYGLFGSSSPPPATSQPTPGALANSKTFSSPPKTSTWDFLNPFETFENYYPHYASSRSSKEVREDEGIPELEEDEQEVIKEAYGDQKFVASTSAASIQEHSNKSAPAEKDDIVGSAGESASYHVPPKEDEIVEKKVVSDKLQRSQEVLRSVVPIRKYQSVSEVASEIRVQYERAAESTKELSRMLEVGKHPYSRKGSICAGSSRMLCSLPVSLSKDEDFVYVEDKVMRTGNISSTLQKLYIWELKLLNEVRVEEKMRVLHERKSKKLQRLDEKGAESHKIDVTQKLLKKLETKITIAIQVVNSISIKINVLRDEELWPEIDELIKGLERMWKAMSACHQIQCQAIVSEAAHLDSVSYGGGIRLSDSHVNAVMQLEVELLRWIGNFAAWTNSHKSFVKSLNSWLVLCLHYEPEVTADGIPPYSPGRIGAPPAFVVFNSWSQALDRISEGEVLDAMQVFASSVKQIWRPNDMELQQKLMANKEIEKLHRMRERETKVIHRELEALNKKLIVNSAQDDLQSALRRAFEAMDSFSENLVKAYDDIHARVDEEKVAVEVAKHSQN